MTPILRVTGHPRAQSQPNATGSEVPESTRFAASFERARTKLSPGEAGVATAQELRPRCGTCAQPRDRQATRSASAGTGEARTEQGHESASDNAAASEDPGLEAASASGKDANGLQEELADASLEDPLSAEEESAELQPQESDAELLLRDVATQVLASVSQVKDDASASATQAEAEGEAESAGSAIAGPAASEAGGSGLKSRAALPAQAPIGTHAAPALASPVQAARDEATAKPEGQVASSPVAPGAARQEASSMQPAALKPVLSLPDSASPETDANTARVMRGLSTATQQTGGSLTLRLHPEDLGMVRIELQLAEGSVRAQITTQTDAARELLTRDLTQLRESLHRHGLTVEKLEVQVSAPSPSDAGQQAMDHGNDGRSRGRDSQPQPRQASRAGERFSDALAATIE